MTTSSHANPMFAAGEMISRRKPKSEEHTASWTFSDRRGHGRRRQPSRGRARLRASRGAPSGIIFPKPHVHGGLFEGSPNADSLDFTVAQRSATSANVVDRDDADQLRGSVTASSTAILLANTATASAWSSVDLSATETPLP